MDVANIFWALLSLFVVALAYFAALAFFGGLAVRLYLYLVTPMPLPAALTPAPQTDGGVILRIFKDVTLFPSLFKADKRLWAGAWLFHVALAAILFRHLRYVTYPVPELVLYMETTALIFAYIFGMAALYLFWRRMALPRTLYVSNLPDYFALALLGSIAGSGILVSYWAHVPLVEVKAFLLGLMTLRPVPPPQHPLFLIHFLLVLILMLYFPFSKLLHAGGIFMAPTRHQPYQIQVPGKRYENPLESPLRPRQR